MDFKNINTTAKFSKFQVLNPDFVRCKCNVFYTGENRNYSNITDEALQNIVLENIQKVISYMKHIPFYRKKG